MEATVMLVSGGRQERIANKRSVAVEARERLMQCDYQSVKAILCEYHEGVLFLRGRLPSYYLKQRAQEAVRTVAGVEEIVNLIEVSPR